MHSVLSRTVARASPKGLQWLQQAPTLSSLASSSPGPAGSLFQSAAHTPPTDLQSLVGMTGSIERTFGSNDNAVGLLATGGSGLAAHASFDPDYHRAKTWITNHPVGNSVISPIFLSGLTGALTEAAFPQAVVTSQSMRQKKPLIVGVPVNASIEVRDVIKAEPHGYTVHLNTKVSRVRDSAIIAEGTQELWVPDY